MKKYLGEYILAIGAGIGISVGGAIYLSLDNKIIGSLMFTVGLYMIVLNGLFLYTGKIGYLVNEKPKYLWTLLMTWLGNLTGTWLGAMALRATKLISIADTAKTMCDAKVSQPVMQALILAIFCGLLMFVAVDGYKETKNPLILFLCVSVFILCGFEHCIANMFYFSVGASWSLKALGYILIMTLGNSIGGMLIPFLKRVNSALSE